MRTFEQERDAALEKIMNGLPYSEEWEAEKLVRLSYLLAAANTDPELKGYVQALNEVLPSDRHMN